MVANMSISQKIYGLAALLLLITVSVSFIGIIEMKSIGTEIEDIAERDMPITEKLTTLTIHQLEQAILFEQSIAVGARMAKDNSLKEQFKALQGNFSDLGHKVEKEIVEVEAILASSITTAHTELDKAEFNLLLGVLKNIEAEHSEYEVLAEQALQLVRKNNKLPSNAIIENIEHQQEVIDKELEVALKEIEHYMEAALLKVEEDEHHAVFVLQASAIAAVAFGLIIAFLLIRSLLRPINQMTATMKELATGNIDVDVPSVGLTNEIGQMANALQVFKESAIENIRLEEEEKASAIRQQERDEIDRQRENAAKDAERQREVEENSKREAREAHVNTLTSDFSNTIEGILNIVAASSSQMEASSKSMSELASQNGKTSVTVAAAAEQATASVQTVASATEELSASISEIGGHVTQSAEISRKAVGAADATGHTISQLADAAQKIGDVVDLINDIAGQTNLLALNATIEAARAGEAGKGFAVVASEVKNLASQTAKATEDISAQISAIQGSTENAVGAVEGIRKTISEMNDIAIMITSAVDEQGVATNEISRSVQEAASGTQNVSQSIDTVKTGSKQTGEASIEVLTASRDLTDRFQTLRSEVEEFLRNIKAA
ncbi:hypothetical protein A9Q83_03290 [Alphaproteobacteria bacterium 46_93_T64]|nr:hypothetical protein A9Q83_03290 [Alphaproteobacteria bacterium 46_93_T64]